MSAASRRRSRGGGEGGGGHDGGGMMRWLLTYADMITLLLVFFIVLYALSKINEAKYKSLMEALHAALHGQVVTTVGHHHKTRAIYPPPATQPAPVPKISQSSTNHLLKELRAVVQRDHLQAQLSVQSVPQGVVVVIHTGVLFPTAEATIQPGAAKILGDVGKVLSAVPNQVVVQGFTDDQPIHTPIFHSNWDLSAARAASVVDFWAAQGLKQTRFIVEGFGQFSPVATNTTAAGRAKNRRVDVVVLKNSVLPQTTLVVGSG